MKKTAATVSKMATIQWILLLLGVLCLTVGIVAAIGVGVKPSYRVQALVDGAVISSIGTCLIAYVFREWRYNIHLRRLQDVEWMVREKERWKEKLRNKTELELMRALSGVCSDKYHMSTRYWRKRESLGISSEMVFNSKKEAKRRAIMELLQEVYGWK
jgi:hypothetical protein